MSEREHKGNARQSARDDRTEGILAADDTGMVRNEADIVSANMEEEMELPSNDSGASDAPAPPA
jgi:hypothetical protein